MGLILKFKKLVSGESLDFVGQAANQANAMVLLGKSLAEAAHHVSDYADEQVEYTSDVAASIEQMGASIKEVAESAASTTTATAEMSELNKQGLQDMQKLDLSIHDVQDLFFKLEKINEKLQQSSSQVSEVVEIIDRVAEQTNMLSINATIEAAHAGTHGRGFTVVAREVRDLAKKTKESTKEIASAIAENTKLSNEVSVVIHDSLGLVENSVKRSESTIDGMFVVANEIETVSSMVQRIASATIEQSAAAESIGHSIEGVVKLAQETRTDANNSYQTGNDLSKMAAKLEERVDNNELEFFGLVPLENAIKMNKSFRPLCSFIGSILEKDFYIRLGHDYSDAIHDIGTGHALISYQTPSTYIEANEKFGIEPLVVPLTDGEPFYQSAIVVREDSGITDIRELSRKTFAFGDPKSTGSKAMPESMLIENSVMVDDLSGYDFLGSHDNVAHAVLNGKFDAGGLMLSVAEQFLDKGLKILAISANIPQFPICASNKLSHSDKEKIINALVNLKDEKILKSLGKKITGFARIKNSDYDSVREMLKKL